MIIEIFNKGFEVIKLDAEVFPHPLDSSIKLAVHHTIDNKDYWSVTDVFTGRAFVTNMTTKKIAIEAATKLLKDKGIDKYKTMLKKFPSVDVLKMQLMYGKEGK